MQMNKKLRVGIPRTLAYYTFYPMWKVFIEKLGAEVILSKATNRKILEDGIKETVNDACIPIKIFHGHVIDLIGKVDYIFIPRMVSADGVATFCPKFLGLPDMVRFSGADLPPIIDVRYNRKGLPGGLFRFFKEIAKQLGIKNPIITISAAIKALRVQRRYQTLLEKGVRPLEAFKAIFDRRVASTSNSNNEELVKTAGKTVKVALLGYPYAIFDQFISAGVYSKLIKLGAEVTTFEQIPHQTMKRYSKVMPQNFFWYYSNQVCWAGLYLLDQKNMVDGIIHVTAFGCGPDAMVDKTLELEAKAAGVPFLSLTIDEHTGEGGVQTRLEAFVDMLRIRKQMNRAG